MNGATMTAKALLDEMALASPERWVCSACLGARHAWRCGGAHLSCRSCRASSPPCFAALQPRGTPSTETSSRGPTQHDKA